MYYNIGMPESSEEAQPNRENPAIIRDLVVKALGEPFRKELEQMDGGLKGALERGKLVYQHVPESNNFLLGFQTTPHENQNAVAVSGLVSPSENNKLMSLIEREFPTAFTALTEQARNWVEGKEIELSDILDLSSLEVDEKLLAKADYELFKKLVEQSSSGKIRARAVLDWSEEGGEVEEYYQVIIGVSADPTRTDRQALLIYAAVPISLHADKPVSFYLLEDGTKYFSPEQLEQLEMIVPDVTPANSADSVLISETTPKEISERLKELAAREWEDHFSLLPDTDLKIPKVENLYWYSKPKGFESMPSHHRVIIENI